MFIPAERIPTHTPRNQSDVLFIDDIAHILRLSRTTIERRRRNGSFPIPELPTIDKRPRWSRSAVDEFLSSFASSSQRHQHRPVASHEKRVKA